MKRLWLLAILLFATSASADNIDKFTWNPTLKTFQAQTHANGTKSISSTGFYNHQDDDNTSGGVAQAEATFYHTVVPVTGVYRVSVMFLVYSGTVIDNQSNGVATIKTGSATYASATYRCHGLTAGGPNRQTGTRFFGNTSCEWIGALNAGDTVHMGVSVVDIVGTGGHSEHFFNVQQIQ